MSRDGSFNTSWFNEYVGDSLSILDDLEEIRRYAYAAFDKLDGDGNGYIDRTELVEALTSDQLSPQERSFIAFLLSNQENIAEAFDENDPDTEDQISKVDLETYFNNIMSMF